MAKVDVNVGLVYDVISTRYAHGLAESNRADDGVKEFAKKHFARDREVWHELRMSNALCEATAENETVAGRIIAAARDVIVNLNGRKLAAEKLHMDRDAQQLIEEGDIERVPTKEIRRTVHRLFCEWRKGKGADIVEVARLEDAVVKHLLSEKATPAKQLSREDVDPLVTKLMIRKFNERYSKQLTKGQQQIIELYAFNPTIEGERALHDNAMKIKGEALREIKSYITENDKTDGVVCSKLKKIARMLSGEKYITGQIQEEQITRLLAASALVTELKEAD